MVKLKKIDLNLKVFSPFKFVIITALCVVAVIFALVYGREYMADYYFKKSFIAYDFFDYKTAESDLKIAIKIYPRNSEYWILLSKIKLGDLDKKIKERKATTDQKFVDSLRDSGSEILGYLNRAAEISPDNFEIYHTFGLFYESMIPYVNDMDRQASFSYLKSLSLGNYSEENYVAILRNLINYSDSLNAMNRQKEKVEIIALAKGTLDDYSKKFPANGVIKFYSGLIDIRSGNIENGIKQLLSIKKDFVDQNYLDFQIGVGYLGVGDFDNAKAYLFSDSIKKSPYSDRARSIYDLFYKKNKDL